MNKSFWGSWDWPSGKWTPNPHLQMDRDEQHRQNLIAGYSCVHEYNAAICPVCKGKEPLLPNPPQTHTHLTVRKSRLQSWLCVHDFDISCPVYSDEAHTTLACVLHRCDKCGKIKVIQP